MQCLEDSKFFLQEGPLVSHRAQGWSASVTWGVGAEARKVPQALRWVLCVNMVSSLDAEESKLQRLTEQVSEVG